MSLQLDRFDSVEAAAAALVDQIGQTLTNHLREAARALLLVSGGRSPAPFFEALAQAPLPWSVIDVSLVDERCVPGTHDDANSRMIQQLLLCDAAASARWLPLVDPVLAESVGNQWTLAQQSAEAANRNPALAQPAAVVLGMGNDGHTASLFADAPQWDEARSTAQRYVALVPAVAAHARVGLSLQALRKQRTCFVWASGADKLATLRTITELVDAYAAGQVSESQLVAAGPLALLIADPNVLLHVFHS
ncbi:MAG: 6-phosphogluconolactonase [Pseudomonadota bacterium]|nr:6-phosphogluconolactonase [Pseudomonadota bacterium]